MKDNVERLFLLGLACFSFFYTDKVIDMINKSNPLMIEIVDVKSSYDVAPVNAIIDGDTIVPGINGKEINVDESYNNMKLGGIFREDSLVFNDIYPVDSIKDNMNKYIIKGNEKKKQVAILYILNVSYINEMKKYKDVTIFVNHKDLTNNNIKLIKYNEIYSYGINGKYSKEVLISDNALINGLSNNKSTYCLVKNKNEDILKICSDNGMYTILPSVIGNYYDVKKNISNGSIILLDNLNDYDMIVKYIKSKGYNIVSLSELINE